MTEATFTASPLRESSPSANVCKALVAAQGMATAVAKSGNNTYDRYTYGKLEDYVHVIRPVLAACKLAVLTTKRTMRRFERTTAQGKPEQVCEAELTFRLVHESGEWIEIDVIGEGQDRSDKAVYKAYTGARKYGLAQLFNLTTSDDPEEDNRPPAEEAPRARRQDRQEPAAPPAAERPAEEPPATPEERQAFVDTWYALMKARGWEREEARAALKTVLAKTKRTFEMAPASWHKIAMDRAKDGSYDGFAKEAREAAAKAVREQQDAAATGPVKPSDPDVIAADRAAFRAAAEKRTAPLKPASLVKFLDDARTIHLKTIQEEMARQGITGGPRAYAVLNEGDLRRLAVPVMAAIDEQEAALAKAKK